MKRVVLLLVATALGVFAFTSAVLALPAESPDNTPMVNGPVRAIDQVGGGIWVGGNFTQVNQRDGSLVDNVSGLAVFDAATGQYRDIAPMLSGTSPLVRDIEPYGNGDVLIAGSFAGPGGTQKNLVRVDGTTGTVVRWYNSPGLQSVLAAPELGRVYGGGLGLSAFDAASGERLWTRATTSVDPALRARSNAPGYRDLELDGRTIWAACICDSVAGAPAKALVRLNTEGQHDTSWTAGAEPESFGLSLVEADGALYLGAGGNDFLARYDKADGRRVWFRDTSGSTQAVEQMGDKLVVGGHFWEVADAPADRCGFRTQTDTSKLDPFDECQTRHGLAIYSLDGVLEPGWDPMVEGRYNLVWALHPDVVNAGALHFGGEFTSVNTVRQTFYGRVSEAGDADVTAPTVQAPTYGLAAAGSTFGTSTVPVKVAWSATDDASGVASYELQISKDGGAYEKVALITTTSRTVSLSPGSTYRFRVKATDRAGNTSGWAEGPQVGVEAAQEEGVGPVTYAGAWADEALTSAFGGSTRYTPEPGATASYAFGDGTDVAWAAQKGPDRGKAEVWIDGARVQTVDLYATTEQPRRVVFRAPLGSAGPHTLQVKVLGTKRTASTDTRVDVDVFVALR